MKCTAHNRRGEPCQKFAVPGSVVCTVHGGLAPNTVAKAEVRMTLAQLLKEDPRPVGVAMLDALSTIDAIFREAKVRVGDETNAEDLGRLLEAAERVMKLGKTFVDTGLVAKLTEQASRDMELEGKIMVEVVSNVVDSLVNLLPISLNDRAAWRTYALGTAMAALVNKPEHAPPPPPPLRMIDAVVVDERSSEIDYSVG
jgi:hypothetical protein